MVFDRGRSRGLTRTGVDVADVQTGVVVAWLAVSCAVLAWWWPVHRNSKAQSNVVRVPEEKSTPMQREWARIAMRVHQQAFLRAGGAKKYVTQMESNWDRAEVLARALCESRLSVVLSGAETGMGALVVEQIKSAWGVDAAIEVLSDVMTLHDADMRAHGRSSEHPDAQWAWLRFKELQEHG